LKKDLREDPIAIRKIGESYLRLVTEHEGEIVAHEIGAKMYLECSSLSGEGVDTVFEKASQVPCGTPPPISQKKVSPYKMPIFTYTVLSQN
jgi:hypothetical protein